MHIELTAEELFQIQDDLEIAAANTKAKEDRFQHDLNQFFARKNIALVGKSVKPTGLCMYDAVIVSILEKYNILLERGDAFLMRHNVTRFCEYLMDNEDTFESDLFFQLGIENTIPLQCQQAGPNLKDKIRSYLYLHEVSNNMILL